MKISDQNAPIQLDAYIRQAQQKRQPDEAKASAVQRPGTSDKVELSEQGKQIQQATQSVNNESEVREDKVRQIKMDVEKGIYKVSGAQVATDMLNETIENNVILQKISTKA
jgi:negative regulator of flagellin synthesis FlgM